jgi:hypothetical protein
MGLYTRTLSQAGRTRIFSEIKKGAFQPIGELHKFWFRDMFRMDETVPRTAKV